MPVCFRITPLAESRSQLVDIHALQPMPFDRGRAGCLEVIMVPGL